MRPSLPGRLVRRRRFGCRVKAGRGIDHRDLRRDEIESRRVSSSLLTSLGGIRIGRPFETLTELGRSELLPPSCADAFRRARVRCRLRSWRRFRSLRTRRAPADVTFAELLAAYKVGVNGQRK